MHTKKVVLYVESSSGYGRKLIKGIVQYSWHYGPWEFFRIPYHYFRDSSTRSRVIQRIKKWQPDGAIVREAREGDKILQLGVPTIVSPNPVYSTNFPSVVTDDLGAGKMAAEYFLELGYRNMAFCGYQNLIWSKKRCDGFLKRLANEPVNTFVFDAGKKLSPEKESEKIADWLRSLPPQVGLFACNDDRGEEIVELCKFQDIRVPEQIAVLGMDNDEITASLCVPQLSSIAMDTVNVGFQAAQMLDDLMAGRERMQSQQILDKATKVITRQSTDSKPINDPHVAEAVWFIRQNIRNKINANDVIKTAGIPRNTLYARFQKALGKSIYETIQDEKVKYMSRLLLQTDMTVSQIAIQLSESDDKNISRIFRRKTGLTPQRYRILKITD